MDRERQRERQREAERDRKTKRQIDRERKRMKLNEQIKWFFYLTNIIARNFVKVCEDFSVDNADL